MEKQIRMGFCVDNNDPTSQGKITCSIPSLNIKQSSWINRCNLSRSWSIPQVGALVILIHEEGDQDYMEYIGTSTKALDIPITELKPTLTPDDVALYIDNNVYLKINDVETIIKQISTYLKLEAAVATLESASIKLGSSATEAAVLGNAFKTFIDLFIVMFNAHTHNYTDDGNPMVTLLPNSIQTPMPAGTLSSKVKIQ